MTTKTFPVSNNILQIPVNEFKKFLEQPKHFRISVKVDQIEIEESNSDFDLDFRELKDNEITPEIQAAYEEAKNAPSDRFLNL